MSPETVSSRQRTWKEVEKNLRNLRRRGLRDTRLDDLTDLMDIARRLSSKATDRERVEDAVARAIGACWGGSQESGPTLRDAMLLWFGLTAVDNPQAPDPHLVRPADRHTLAWEYLEGERLREDEKPRESEATFRTGKAEKRYVALAKKLIEMEKLVEKETPPAPSSPVVPAALSASTEMGTARADQVTQASLPATTQTASKNLVHKRHRAQTPLAALIIAFATTVATAAGLIVWLTQPTEQPYANPNTVPPKGAIVNAENGAVSLHVSAESTLTPVELAGGHGTMVACIVSGHQTCHYATTLHARAGDIIKFSVELVDLQDQLIPYLKLVAAVVGAPGPNGREPVHELRVNLSVEWPDARNEGSFIKSFETDYTQLQFPGTAAYTLSYIPGSTRLLTPSGELLHSLPDGIMEYGIALQDVGSPPRCLRCNREYARYVNFRARVGVAK